MRKFMVLEKRKYLLIIFLFLFGILLGSFSAVISDKTTTEEVSSSLEKFFSAYLIQGASKSDAFQLSLLNHLSIAMWLWVSGWHPLLLSIGVFQTLLKGFRTGFTISSLCHCYIGKGILFSLLAIIPTNLFFLTALCFYLTSQMQFALDRQNLRKGLISVTIKKQIYLRHITTTVIFLFLMVVCAWIDGYLVPTLLQPLCGFFL